MNGKVKPSDQLTSATCSECRGKTMMVEPIDVAKMGVNYPEAWWVFFECGKMQHVTRGNGNTLWWSHPAPVHRCRSLSSINPDPNSEHMRLVRLEAYKSLLRCGYDTTLDCPFCHEQNVYTTGVDSEADKPEQKYKTTTVHHQCEQCRAFWDTVYYWGKGSTYVWIQITHDPEPEAQYDGFVYFIEAEGSQRIKIGYSKDPDGRIKSLQTGSPFPLKLLLAVPANQEKEAELHQQFADLRLDGEWFHAAKRLRDHIEKGACNE